MNVPFFHVKRTDNIFKRNGTLKSAICSNILLCRGIIKWPRFRTCGKPLINRNFTYERTTGSFFAISFRIKYVHGHKHLNVHTDSCAHIRVPRVYVGFYKLNATSSDNIQFAMFNTRIGKRFDDPYERQINFQMIKRFTYSSINYFALKWRNFDVFGIECSYARMFTTKNLSDIYPSVLCISFKRI